MYDRNIKEAASYHALALLHSGEHKTLKRIRDEAGSWEKACEHAQIDLKKAVSQFETLKELGVTLILREDERFPEMLREIPWPPHAIYIKGAPLGTEVCVGIVGTRKATKEGKQFAAKIAISLGKAGVTIVSGLALGIDAAAQGAVTESEARTIAVIATGIDKIYPKENERIGANILSSRGTILSEYPPGLPALPHRFIERNRIISGLSRGVIVIEAPESSGSLATANFALEQNRDVFVSPGFPEHPNYTGSHKLIKAGATLITSAEDVLLALGIETKNGPAELPFNTEKLDATEKAIINVLVASGVPMGVPAIVEETGLNPREVGATLGSLVILGIIEDRLGTFAIATK